jgi:RNA polymerase sigma factor (sigma-70 family)
MRADVSAAFTEEHESGLRVPARLLRLVSDERLVDRVRIGSESAFEAIFDRHHRGILAFCRHMLGSVEEAEDAVQHTFLAAYRELVGSAKPIQLKPWLYTIARNRCLTVLRTRGRQSLAEIHELPTEHLAAEVERRHDLQDLLCDVAGLPDDQRAALVLSELGDMSHDEIAAVLDCRRDKVKALVFQARSSLIASREARETPCADIREQLANLRGGALRRTELRRHLRECAGCREYRQQVQDLRRDLAVALPVAPTVGLKAAVIGGGGAAAGSVASGSLAAKVIVVAALATGGTVAVERTAPHASPPARPAPHPTVHQATAAPHAGSRAAAPASAHRAEPAAAVKPKTHAATAPHAKKAPPGHAKKTPPGQAKKAFEPAKKTPPGQAKKAFEPAKKTPPGQAKKAFEPAKKTPPGQAKKAFAPAKKTPPGQAKQAEPPAKASPGQADKVKPTAAKVSPGQAKKLQAAAATPSPGQTEEPAAKVAPSQAKQAQP